MEAVEPVPEPPEIPKEKTLLERIRNSWEFANLGQWIYFFGPVVKIDNIHVEVCRTHS